MLRFTIIILFFVTYNISSANDSGFNDCAERIDFSYSSGTIKLFLDAENVSGSSVRWTFPDDDDQVFSQFSRIAIPFSELPESCESKLIGVRYRDTETNEYIECQRRIYFCDPFACDEVITDSYQVEDNTFRLAIQQATFDENQSLQWINDETNQVLGTGATVFVPATESCRRIPISVRYFDLATDSWRICCRRLPLCPPEDCSTIAACQQNIDHCNLIEAEASTAISATSIPYNFNADNLTPGNDFCKWEIRNVTTNDLLTTSGIFNFDYVFNASGTYTVILYYHDAAEDCLKTCQRDILVQAPDFSYQGRIYRHSTEQGIATVNINAIGNNSIVTQTDTLGQYQFGDLRNLGSFSIQPQKDTLYQEGISLTDVILLNAHLAGDYDLNPYQLIAADVDGSRNITAVDVNELKQIFRQQMSRFSNNASWRFVPAEYDFPTHISPLTVPFPESFDHNFMTTGMDEQDFIGIKIGDIDDGEALPITIDSLHLYTTTTTTVAGDEVLIDVQLAESADLWGGQFQLNWDTTYLQLLTVETENSVLEDASSVLYTDLQNIGNGTLGIQWLPTMVNNLADSSMLFQLRFQTTTHNGTTTLHLTDVSQDITGLINQDLEHKPLNFQSGSITINPVDLLVNYSINDVKCEGSDNGSIILNVANGTSSYTVEWSHGVIQANIPANLIVLANLEAGTYAARITDDETGSSTMIENMVVSEPDLLVIETINQTSVNCGGGADGQIEIAVTGGVAPYQYQWSTGATTATIFDLSAGDFSVTVTDDNGCEQMTHFTISEPTPIDVEITTLPVSAGINGRATAVANGGTRPYQYTWSHDENVTDSIAYDLTDGIYEVTIIDARGCMQSSTFTIERIVAVSQWSENTKALQVYPNPAQHHLTIQWTDELKKETNAIVAIYTLQGKLVDTYEVDTQLSSTTIHLNLQLPNDIYILKFQNKNHIAYQRFMISF